jgi:hypothetical protein
VGRHDSHAHHQNHHPYYHHDNDDEQVPGVTGTQQQQQQQYTKLPWEEVPEADITSLEIVMPTNDETMWMLKPQTKKQEQEENDNLNTIDSITSTQLMTKQNKNNLHHHPATNDADVSSSTGLRVAKEYAAVYDCIIDQGLLGAVVQIPSKKEQQDTTTEVAVQQLLSEASLALREHGIYVLLTQQLSYTTMSLLEKYSHQTGLQWQFKLDGISNNTTQVSVARRYNTGAMPSFGKLSRFQV